MLMTLSLVIFEPPQINTPPPGNTSPPQTHLAITSTHSITPAPLVIKHSSREHMLPSWLSNYHTNLPSLSQHQSVKVNTVIDATTSAIFACVLSQVTTLKESTSFKQARSQVQWVNAMNDELNALELKHTWTVTDLPPTKKNPIGCKWL